MFFIFPRCFIPLLKNLSVKNIFFPSTKLLGRNLSRPNFKVASKISCLKGYLSASPHPIAQEVRRNEHQGLILSEGHSKSALTPGCRRVSVIPKLKHGPRSPINALPTQPHIMANIQQAMKNYLLSFKKKCLKLAYLIPGIIL